MLPAPVKRLQGPHGGIIRGESLCHHVSVGKAIQGHAVTFLVTGPAQAGGELKSRPGFIHDGEERVVESAGARLCRIHSRKIRTPRRSHNNGPPVGVDGHTCRRVWATPAKVRGIDECVTRRVEPRDEGFYVIPTAGDLERAEGYRKVLRGG